jgi:SAM-dependent methyltransferase
MLLTSRSFDEYCASFDLDPERLPAQILDCAAGASDFVAQATARGATATAVDPGYRRGAAVPELARAGMHSGTGMIDSHRDRFTYAWYGSPQARTRMRDVAMQGFADDYAAHPERYVAAELPDLPFADRAFDLAVCSHLLFTWATDLDEQWHLNAIHELTRVATEVRIFPLVLQQTGDPVPFMDHLLARLADHGITTERKTVTYEFQIGANQMLRLARDRSE